MKADPAASSVYQEAPAWKSFVIDFPLSVKDCLLDSIDLRLSFCSFGLGCLQSCDKAIVLCVGLIKGLCRFLYVLPKRLKLFLRVLVICVDSESNIAFVSHLASLPLSMRLLSHFLPCCTWS